MQQTREELNRKRREYYQKNKDSIKNSVKKYNSENKEKVIEWKKEYYQRNKDKILQKTKKWKDNNIDRLRENRKDYYLKNREKELKRVRDIATKNMESWVGVIPKKTKCSICGKELFFNKSDRDNAIHFDHKKPNNLIKSCPTAWLRRNEMNSFTKSIWEKCDFGILCRKCNLLLPTKNRKEWLDKVINYIKEVEKCCQF